MAVICSLFATFSFATNIVDSRDNHNYKTLPSGKLNWFSGNLAYKNPEAQTNNGTVYYPNGSWKNACPEGTHLPTISEWSEFKKDRFTGPRKIPNIKNFAGKTRDGNQYKVEQKAGKLWMTANLRFSLQSAKQCFLEDTLFCKKHGRFYTYHEAKKACPPGWHLPDDGEWRDYQKDQSKLDWNNLGKGGCKDWDGYCEGDNTGHYWSASKVKKNTARSWEFRRKGKNINRTDESTQKGLYVRCVAELE